jgi:hypothetical protein
MSLNQTVVNESRASRGFRLAAPLLVALGLVAASIAPGIMLG